MNTILGQAIDAAVHEPRFDDRAFAVKRAVADSVSRIDRAVVPKFTEHFNHTWIPDIVLEWPGERRERYLYLRSERVGSWWESDLHDVDRRQAMIVSVDGIGSEFESGELERVQEVSRQTNTWITDARGLGTLDEVSSSEEVSAPVHLVSTALLKGGRGVADSGGMERLLAGADRTFQSASGLDEKATRRGLTDLDEHLNEEQSGRFSRVLRAIWEGSGGDGLRFPSSRSLGPLNNEDLEYIVETLDHADPVFWRNVGRHLTTAQLASLSVDSTRRAFQLLVSSNLDRITAKALGVLVADGFVIDAPYWGLSGGQLTLSIDGYVFAFAAQRREELTATVVGGPMALADLRGRLGQADGIAVQVDLVRHDRASAKFEVGESGDLLSDNRLADAIAAFGSDRLRTVVLRIPGSGNISVDLTNQIAVAPTSALHPIDRLVRAVVPLFARDSDVRTFIGQVRSSARNLPDMDGRLF